MGLPVAKLLLDENATVTITHSRTKNLADVTREAEILVVAIGRPKFVTADMVGDGAVVIDVGVNRDPETGKLCGDVDFEACEPKAFAGHESARRGRSDDDRLSDREYDRGIPQKSCEIDSGYLCNRAE